MESPTDYSVRTWLQFSPGEWEMPTCRFEASSMLVRLALWSRLL
jgi:hypothetical protein